ncbi:MAG: hypothetical protein HY873_08465, partial [Chloroflexi bacterium]|nr:hypothetical protein [Chloroflexota bacterium]
MFAALALTIAACDDADNEGASATPTVTAAPTAMLTATAAPAPTPDLAALIDTRAPLPLNDPRALSGRYRRTDGVAPASRPFAGEAVAASSREFIVSRITGATLSQTAPP